MISKLFFIPELNEAEELDKGVDGKGGDATAAAGRQGPQPLRY